MNLACIGCRCSNWTWHSRRGGTSTRNTTVMSSDSAFFTTTPAVMQTTYIEWRWVGIMLRGYENVWHQFVVSLPEGLLSCSQEHITGSYLVPVETTPHPHTLFFINILVLFSCMFWSPKRCLPFRVSDKFLLSVASLLCVIRTCFDHLICMDLIIGMVFTEESNYNVHHYIIRTDW
jgi:hypothetical protein